MRRVIVNNDRSRDIWIRAGGCDSQHNFISVFEPCDRVVGLANYLDHDSRLAIRLDRADAGDRRRFVTEQRARRDRDMSARQFDPEFAAVRAEIEGWS